MKRVIFLTVMFWLICVAVLVSADTLRLELQGGDVGEVICHGNRMSVRKVSKTELRVECLGTSATPTQTNTPALPTNTPTPTDTPAFPTDTPTPTDTPAVPTNTPTPTSTPGAPTGRLAGILASPSSGYNEAFSTIASRGGNATSLQAPVNAAELQAAVDASTAMGLGLIGRASSGSFIIGGSIDINALINLIQNQFGGTDLAGQLTGYYLIDEPCHPKNSGITPQQMVDFYQTIKALEPNLQVLVNYSYADCLQEMTSLGQTADIGAVCRNVSRPDGYWEGQAATVAEVKEQYPNMTVLAWSAVYEYPAKGIPIPSAEWVRTTGMEAASYDAFDGVMYFPWSPSSYMGDTIEDVADDPAYISAFSDVFAVTRQ